MVTSQREINTKIHSFKFRSWGCTRPVFGFVVRNQSLKSSDAVRWCHEGASTNFNNLFQPNYQTERKMDVRSFRNRNCPVIGQNYHMANLAQLPSATEYIERLPFPRFYVFWHNGRSPQPYTRTRREPNTGTFDILSWKCAMTTNKYFYWVRPQILAFKTTTVCMLWQSMRWVPQPLHRGQYSALWLQKTPVWDWITTAAGSCF